MGRLVEHGQVGVDPLNVLRRADRAVRVRRRVLDAEAVLPLADALEAVWRSDCHVGSGGSLQRAVRSAAAADVDAHERLLRVAHGVGRWNVSHAQRR